MENKHWLLIAATMRKSMHDPLACITCLRTLLETPEPIPAVSSDNKRNREYRKLATIVGHNIHKSALNLNIPSFVLCKLSHRLGCHLYAKEMGKHFKKHWKSDVFPHCLLTVVVTCVMEPEVSTRERLVIMGIGRRHRRRFGSCIRIVRSRSSLMMRMMSGWTIKSEHSNAAQVFSFGYDARYGFD